MMRLRGSKDAVAVGGVIPTRVHDNNTKSKRGRALLQSILSWPVAAAFVVGFALSRNVPSWPAQAQTTDALQEAKPLGGWVEKVDFVHAVDKLVALKERGKLKKRSCPCCGWHGDDDFDNHLGKPNRKCPVCGSFERHRRACAVLGGGRPRPDFNLSSSWLTPAQERQDAGLPFRLVHFGPQKFMEDKLSQVRGVDHVGLDFLVKQYQSQYSSHVLHADITDIPLPTRFADGILNFHVLEHIPNVEQAFSELKRILYHNDGSFKGWLLLETPCRHLNGRHKDCRGNMTKQERIDCAGQWDHVWIYDCDKFGQDLSRQLNCYAIDGTHPNDFGRAASIIESCHCTYFIPLYVCTA